MSKRRDLKLKSGLAKSSLLRYAKSPLLERTEDGDNTPIYFHNTRCSSFCDYACNGSHGTDIAEDIAALESEAEHGK
jgi:hypothetical protein